MKRNLLLSLAAGLVGGALSTYLHPVTARAQSQPPEEIRAQSFTLVNEKGTIFGSFSFDQQGRPQIILQDNMGHQVWSVVGDHSSHYARFDPK